MEKQKHGFILEEKIIKYYGNIIPSKYNDKFDGILKKDDKYYLVEIKSVKDGGEICYSSFKSKFAIDYTKYDYIKFIVIYWTGDCKSPNVTKYVDVDIDTEYFINVLLGGSENLSKIIAFENDLVNNMTNSYSDDIRWKDMITFHKCQINKNIIFKPRPKRELE